MCVLVCLCGEVAGVCGVPVRLCSVTAVVCGVVSVCSVVRVNGVWCRNCVLF